MAKLKGERGKDGLYTIKLDGYDKEVKYPSVTTILSTLEDAEVAELKEKLDPEMWDYVSRRGADRGTAMHLYLENYAIALKKGLTKEQSLFFTQKKTPKDLATMDAKFFELGRSLFYNIFNDSDFQKEFVKPVMIEGLMVSPKYKYAGRTDIVYIDNEGKLVMGDYKTSTKTIGDYQRKLVKYKLQCAAYANAFYELYGKMPDYGVIWVGTPDGCQKFIVHKNEMDVYLNSFLFLVDKYYKKYINK